MGYFPFYMDIEGKLCVIAGGGKVAYRKVCDLRPASFWCNYQGRFPGMECRVIRSGRGTVLWEPSETVQTAFFCRG